MSKAYQCDRCKKFYADFVGRELVSIKNEHLEICGGCYDDLKIFMEGLAVPNPLFKGVITNNEEQ